MDIDFTNDEINQICARYQRYWPYEALGIEDSELAKQGKETKAVSSEVILKNLQRMEASGTMSQEQRQKFVRMQKKRMQKGLSEFEIKLMNSQLSEALREKMQIKQVFLHIKKFVDFLVLEIKNFRKPSGLLALTMKQTSLSGLLEVNRHHLGSDEFFEEYKNFSLSNPQNHKRLELLEAV